MMKRRTFLQGTALIATSSTMVAVASPQLIDVNHPTAKALKYAEDASDAVRADKMGTPGSDQICDNCRFYAKPGAEVAGCTLFGGQLVPAQAWCAGWVPVP